MNIHSRFNMELKKFFPSMLGMSLIVIANLWYLNFYDGAFSTIYLLFWIEFFLFIYISYINLLGCEQGISIGTKRIRGYIIGGIYVLNGAFSIIFFLMFEVNILHAICHIIFGGYLIFIGIKYAF